MTTIPGTSTSQRSTGAATVQVAASLNNFMVWTGLGPNTVQLMRLEPAEALERLVLAVGGIVLGTGG